MKHRNIIATIAMVVALVATAAAQAKPDFSGTWTFDEAKSDPAPARAGGGGGGGGGGRGGGRMGGAPATAMTIKQTPAELSMDRTTAQGAQTVVYKLDGSESTNTIGMGPATSKAAWDGSEARHHDDPDRPGARRRNHHQLEGDLQRPGTHADDRDDTLDAGGRTDTQADLHEELIASNHWKTGRLLDWNSANLPIFQFVLLLDVTSARCRSVAQDRCFRHCRRRHHVRRRRPAISRRRYLSNPAPRRRSQYVRRRSSPVQRLLQCPSTRAETFHSHRRSGCADCPGRSHRPAPACRPRRCEAARIRPGPCRAFPTPTDIFHRVRTSRHERRRTRQ